MIPFTCEPSNINEDHYKKIISEPLELTTKLAYLKAESVHKKFPKSIVIGGDQVSVINGKILGKPQSFDKACDQLALLSGQTHRLLTSVCILGKESSIAWTDITELTMRNLSSKEINDYVTPA